MTLLKFKNMVRFADVLGIQTAEDLMNFKSNRAIKNNQDLYMELYNEALIIKHKNVS